MTDQKGQLDILLKVLRKRQKIVVIAGAGISVSAGSTCPLSQSPVSAKIDVVPDFRSDTGLFKTLREEYKLKSSGKDLFDASVYQTDASTSSFHDMVRGLSEQASAAMPTEFHHMLAKLAIDGRLMRLYTQNVDGIETSMPPLETKVPLSNKGPWPRTVQLHGGLENMVCLKCHNIFDFQPALFNGAEAPPCNHCVETDKIRTDHAGKRSHGIGRLRPRIVLYNEHNPDQDAIGAVMQADLKTRPDAVIVVGTSMKIPGVRRFVRELCGVVRDRRDGLTVWINRDPPPVGKEFENCWDLVVEGDCDQVAAHASMKRWNDTSVDYQECTESEVERAKVKNSEMKVIIDSPAKKAVKSALLTPAPSPRSKSVELEEHRKKLSNKLNPPKTPIIFKPKEPSKATSKPRTNTEASKMEGIKAPKIKTTGTKSSKTCSSAAAKAKNTSKTSPTKINEAFKVSKPQAAKPRKPKLVLLSEDEHYSRAMAPISPSAARNNGPIQRDSQTQKEKPPKPLFPNLSPSPARPSIENIHLPVTQNSCLNIAPKRFLSMVRIELGENYFDLGRRARMGTPLVLASEIDERKKEQAVGRLKRLSEEIVSPTSMPGGMRGLLN